MRRNLIVLGGVAVLILAGYFVPVSSFPEKKWYMETLETIRLTSGNAISMGLIILWFMQTISKWRGMLWIFLSVVGPLLTISEAQKDYEWFLNHGHRVDPNYTSGNLSYGIGFYLLLFGYLIVIVGSVWDIVQKRRQEKLHVVPNQVVLKGNTE